MSVILTPIEAAPTSPAADSERERLVRQRRDRHRTMLWVAVVVVILSFALRLGDSGNVALIWPGLQMPTVCGSRALFGIDCPGCGLTRSFVALASGDIRQSLDYHRLGWLLALAVLAQIPYRIFALRELRYRIAERVWPTWFGYFLIAALIANWLVGIGY
jgi:hypothetical protein